MSLTPDGYTTSSLSELVENMAENSRSLFGSLIDTSTDSALGIFNGIVAIEIDNVNTDLKEFYSNLNPNASEGRMLENLCLLGGLVRKGTSKSTGVVDFYGDSGTTIPYATVVYTSDDDTRRFTTREEVTIGSEGSVRVKVIAEVDGAISAPEGTLNTLESPITGVDSLSNPRDISVGSSEVETEAALRQRRSNTLSLGGNGTKGAITAALSQLPSVTTVRVISNNTSFWQEKGTSGTLRPPNSIEVVVEGGDEDDITEALALVVSASTETFGDLTTFYEDITSNTHIIRFSRPSEIDIYINVEYTLYDEETFPEDGDAKIAQAIVDFGDVEYQLGVDVLPDRLYEPCFSVSGLASVDITVGTNQSNLSTDSIPIELYEKAVASVSNISVSQKST